MQVNIRLMGVLTSSDGPKQRKIDVREGSTVGEVIKSLLESDEELHSVLWDESVDSPLPNALIMLDGVEVNNLQGTETILSPRQELVLLSVVHGG